MDFVLGLVVGLLIGVLLSWVLDPLLTPSKSTSMDEVEPLDDSEKPIETSQGFVDSQREITQIIVRDRDDLLRIKGIGPVFSERLTKAGIHTFQQLANTSPARLRRISASEDWQAVDIDGWINQASRLAIDSTRNVR